MTAITGRIYGPDGPPSWPRSLAGVRRRAPSPRTSWPLARLVAGGLPRQLQRRGRVLGLGSALGRLLDPAHHGAVGVRLHRLELERLRVRRERTGRDREELELAGRDR